VTGCYYTAEGRSKCLTRKGGDENCRKRCEFADRRVTRHWGRFHASYTSGDGKGSALFLAQRLHRVDACGATGWDVAR
jgi:hypothetical protein